MTEIKAKPLDRRLFKAVKRHNYKKIQHFLKLGGDPSALLMPEGISSLHYAAGMEDPYAFHVTFVLLLYGANPNVRSLDGLTPLHISAAWGHITILKLLLKYGGDPKMRDFEENTVMSLAVENKQREIIELLQKNQLTQLSSQDAKGNFLVNCNVSDSYHSCESHGDMQLPTLNAQSSTAENAVDLKNADKALCCGCVLDLEITESKPFGSSTSDDGSIASWYTVDEYLCVDDKERVAFIEQQWSPENNRELASQNACSDNTEIYQWPVTENESQTSGNMASSRESVAQSLKGMADNRIVSELKKMGDQPGPITDSTRRVYLRRLHKLRHDIPILAEVKTTQASGYSFPMACALNGALNISVLKDLEDMFMKEFGDVKPITTPVRGGVIKSCFNYLLIDPKISQNLPLRAHSLNVRECFSAFVSAVFYIGKGKNARPYDHFYEALRISNNSKNKVTRRQFTFQELSSSLYKFFMSWSLGSIGSSSGQSIQLSLYQQVIKL